MKLIKKEEFISMGEKTTICLLTLENGFEIVGVSSCVHKRDFNPDQGRRKSKVDAESKLKQHLAFMEQEASRWQGASNHGQRTCF